MVGGKKTGIQTLPTKTNIEDSDVMIIQDKNATYNTTFGKFKEKIATGLNNNYNLEVKDDGKLYLTSEGKIVSEGIKILQNSEALGNTSKWGEF